MMSWHPEPRLRLPAVLAAVLLLGGCSSDGGGDWLSMLQAGREQWENRDAPASLNDAAAIPYATLGVRINGGREQILILATDSQGERLWTSGAKIAIATRQGRIVRTAGFGQDLSGYAAGNGASYDLSRPHRFAWNGDFADKSIFSAAVQCEVQPGVRDPITILGKPFDTVRIDETCRSDMLDWRFTNSYWLSTETGRVWRSIQHVHPDGLTLEIEILRPPLSEG